jgi:rhodanese-related sulfurtransferase
VTSEPHAPQPLDPALAIARRAELVVVDVRDEEAFRSGHLEGSGNVPLSQFKARRAELPPREAPVLVVGDDARRAREAAFALREHGFRRVHWLDAPTASIGSAATHRGPAARLWRPAPFLEEVLPLLPRGRAADLAAGSGREAVFLAMNGFEVEAWDAAPEALARAEALAVRHNVRLTTVACDLEQPSPPLPVERYDLVVCFRFLHRPLFPMIERSLVPGGHLVYETYRVGQERFGKPRRPAFLLERGELQSAFPSLEVLRYEEPEPDGGPVTARLWARKGC